MRIRKKYTWLLAMLLSFIGASTGCGDHGTRTKSTPPSPSPVNSEGNAENGNPMMQRPNQCDETRNFTEKVLASREKEILSNPTNDVEAAMYNDILPTLGGWLDESNPAMWQILGFHNREEIQRAVIGRPYEVFGLNKDQKASPVNFWRAPVLVDRVFRAMVSIRLENGKYIIFEIGSAEFAKSLDLLERRHLNSKEDAAITKRAMLSLRLPHYPELVVYNGDLGSTNMAEETKIYVLSSSRNEFRSEILEFMRENNIRLPRCGQNQISVRQLMARIDAEKEKLLVASEPR